jgi:hypothetical protein
MPPYTTTVLIISQSQIYLKGLNVLAIFSATNIPSIAAEVIPPAYPAPSPQGYSPIAEGL